MRVGINGMGRIGRLALRAAMGGLYRARGRSARGQSPRRRACERAQGWRGHDRASARIRQRPWPLARELRRRGRSRDRRRQPAHRLQRRTDAGRRRLGRSRLRHRAGMHRQVPEAGATGRVFRARRETGDRRRAGEGSRRAQHRRRRQRPSLRAARAPPAHRGVLHHQLPRAGGEGAARGDRHPPRPDHHDPRSDQHQCGGRCAAQGPAARAVGDAVAVAHHDRQRHRHRADLSGTQGQAERPRGARAGAERQPHGLRVRDGAAGYGGRGQRPVPRRRSGAARRHPGFRGATAGFGRLRQRHAQRDRRRSQHAW